MYEVEGGWIPIPRAIRGTIIWKNKNLWRFWSWCYLQAAYTHDVEVVGYTEIPLKPGQLLISLRSAAKETGLTISEVRTCIKRLCEGSFPFISAVSEKLAQDRTMITLLRHTRYNDEQNLVDTAIAQLSHSNDTVIAQLSHTNDTAVAQQSHSVDTPIAQQGVEAPSPSPRVCAPARNKEEVKETHPMASESLLEIGREVLGLTCDLLLDTWVKMWPEDWIVQALWRCKSNDKHGGEASAYAQGILRRWKVKGGPEKDYAESSEKHSFTDSGNTCKSAKSRPKRFGQYSYAEILEARKRGRNSASGVGELFDGFHWGAG